MEILNITRKERGINDNNKYFFANTGEGYFNPYDTLKEFCNNSGVRNIEKISSTSLRKYLATVSQIMNLSPEELNWLASHMGHDLTVHRGYYRLESGVLELSKVSRLLMAMDSGKVHNFAGKSMSDIDPSKFTSNTQSKSMPSQTNESLMDTNEDEADSTSNEIVNLKRKTTGASLESGSEEQTGKNKKTQKRKIELSFDSDNDIYEPEQTDYSDNELDNGEFHERRVIQKSKKKKRPEKWDPNIKAQLIDIFSENIMKKQAPGKNDCEKFKKQLNINRKWVDIKNLIKNTYSKVERKKSKGNSPKDSRSFPF